MYSFTRLRVKSDRVFMASPTGTQWEQAVLNKLTSNDEKQKITNFRQNLVKYGNL